MPSSEMILEDLDARRQITDTIMRYARGVDRNDREMILSAFHPDGWDDHGVFSGPADKFADWVIDLHLGMEWTTHYVTNIYIEVEGDVARSESYAVAMLRYKENGVLCDLSGCGRYFDRFERRGGKWLIIHRHGIADWNRVDPVERQATGSLVELLVRGRRGRDDISYAHFAGTCQERRIVEPSPQA